MYVKHGVSVDKETMEAILEDKERTKAMLQRYEEEKIESMNYILGKPKGNKKFTKFELKAMSIVNLFDRKMIDIYKIIWDNRDNEEQLNKFLKQINVEINERRKFNGNTSINNSGKVVVENQQV